MSNLIDALALPLDRRRFYANTLAWTLDPQEEHGLGTWVLEGLIEVLVEEGAGWLVDADLATASTGVRQRRGRWDVLVVLGSGRIEILGGAPASDEILPDDPDRVVSCCLPAPGQPCVSDLCTWTWSAVAFRLGRPSSGRHAAFCEDLCEHLSAVQDVALGSAPQPVADSERPLDSRVQARLGDSDHEIILSDDMSRAYEAIGVLGEGAQGIVFDVRVKGDDVFPGSPLRIRRAVLKLAKDDPESILLEDAVYRSHPNAGLGRLLDSGRAGGRPYLVLERLHALPCHWFAEGSTPVALDLATAVDTYSSLLASLSKLHFAKGKGLVLCDIKPENILLRLSADGREIKSDDYLQRIAAGAYEPVFADVGCAQDRTVLREAGGRVGTMLGTPYYIAPECVPTVLDGELSAGHYSPAADVYALTLTFYTYLTGALPLSHRGLDRLPGPEKLRTLLDLKRDGASPIDSGLIYGRFDGGVGKALMDVLEAGLNPKPKKRASAPALLNLCRERFGLETVSSAHLAEECGISGLTLRQTRFRRLDPGSGLYARKAKATTRHLRRPIRSR